MNNWINVNDRLPTIGDEVLIIDNDSSVGIAFLNKGLKWYEAQTWTFVSGDWGHYDNDTEVDNKVTHWQPIPEAPSEEVEQRSDGIISPIIVKR